MQIKEYENGMKLIISEMTAILEDSEIDINNDRALLYHYQATYEMMFNKNVKRAVTKAIEFENKAHELCADNPQLGSNIWVNLAYLYRLTKNYNEAEKFYGIAMEYVYLCLENGVEWHHSIDTVRQYAYFLAETEKYDEALILLQDWVLKVGENSIDYADIQYDMGYVLLKMNDGEAAGKCFDKAFRIYEEIYIETPELLQKKYADFKDITEKFTSLIP